MDGDTSARFASQPVDHPSVVGQSSRAREQGDRGNGVLTAELKSRKRRFGPGVSAKWKTHFWVARSADRTIHLYKNDLAIRPKKIIRAADIADVRVGSDRHNKFFHLVIVLRDDAEREVRMRSRESRDRWMAAVLDMTRSVRNDDRARSVLGVVRQLTDEWSREFGIGVEANIGEVVGLAAEAYPSYVNGLIAGAALIRKVVPLLPSTSNANAVTSVRLAVMLHGHALPGVHLRDTRYDPAAKFLHIAVNGVEAAAENGGNNDAGGGPSGGDPAAAGSNAQMAGRLPGAGGKTIKAEQFRTVDVSAVLSMIGSTVWRNPELEEFLREGSNGRAQADRIARLLGVDHFDVSLQWGHDLDAKHDSARIKAYVERFVNARLIADIHDVFSAVIQNGDAHQAANAIAAATGSGGGGAGPTVPANRRFDVKLSGAECLARFVSGIGVLIESDAVSAHRMPAVSLRHDMWRDNYLGPAFTLTSRLRAATGGGAGGPLVTPFAGLSGSGCSGREDPLKNLSAQLLDVVQHVRIAEGCRVLETVCGGELGVKDGGSVAWESLVTAVTACSPSLSESRLCGLLADLAVVYEQRLRGLRSALDASGLLAPVLRSLRGWRITFAQCPSTTGATQADPHNKRTPPTTPGVGPSAVPAGGGRYLPLPAVENHNFVDTVLLLGAHQVQPPSLRTLHTVERVPGLRAAFTLDDLPPWFLGYCAIPGNLEPFPEDVGADAVSDHSSDDEGQRELGEAVAGVRKLEARVFTDAAVAAQVYDSQEGAPPELKASADAIGDGIKAMQGAFPESSIVKHDLARVLALTLGKVRQLVSARNPGRNGALPREAALEVLTAYCEYADTANKVEQALDNAVAENPSSSPLGFSIEPPTEDGQGIEGLPPPADDSGEMAATAAQDDTKDEAQLVSFGQLASAILSFLMPAEAVLAMRARRDVLVVGLENTGKSLIINSLRGIHQPTDPSVGVLSSIVPFREWVFGMKELGGRSEVRKNFKHHIGIIAGSIHGIVAVVDAGQPRTLGVARAFFEEVLAHKAVRGLPCLLLANNSRTDRSMPLADLRRELQFDKLCANGGHAAEAVACDVSLPQHRSSADAGLAAGLEWLGRTLHAA